MARPRKRSSGWRCPRCGREFKQRTLEHSCDVRSVEHHLERGSDDVRATFEALQRVLSRLGPHEVVPVKTMVLLRLGSNFGSLTFGKAHVDVSFFLPERIEHPRVLRVEQVSPTKLAHRVRLAAPRDVDAELIGWLKRAYAECARSSHRP